MQRPGAAYLAAPSFITPPDSLRGWSLFSSFQRKLESHFSLKTGGFQLSLE
jgi:hypothetical protein